MANPALHFVGFRGDEYTRAVRIWGKPGFIHMIWDRRAQREIADGDVVLFARSEHDQPVAERNGSDLVERDEKDPLDGE